MKLILALLFIPVAIFIERLIRFFCAGGTLTQPARNATFMYRQVRIVYDRMPDQQARFMALYINSASARDEIPESFLRDLVKVFASDEWSELCTAYTWAYAAQVGHVDVSLLSDKLRESRTAKIHEQIKFADFAVEHGDRRYESQLRSLPQSFVLQILAKSQDVL